MRKPDKRGVRSAKCGVKEPATQQDPAFRIPHSALVHAGLGSLGRSFYGEIYEDDLDVPMIPAYSNENKPFDIETCCYWKEPFQVANRDETRLIVIRAGNQLFKSGFCEYTGKHKIKYDPGHMCFYDQTKEASDDHAKTRLMPMFKSIPGIGKIIQEVEDDNHWEVTTTDIMLPGMILRARPLNESSTQRITLRYIFIHDASLALRNGQIRRARIRATQFNGRELVIIESQGGLVEQGISDDFTAAMNETDERLLYVNCPLCGGEQHFKWEHKREDGSQGGFKSGTAPDAGATLDENAVMAGTHYECVHCRGQWFDDGDNGPTRRAIDRSTHYKSSRENVLPGRFGFVIPCWINTRIRWGQIMLEKIRADAAALVGNDLLLQDWTQKRAGETWNPSSTRTIVAVITGTYDPTVKQIENECFRSLQVDCQKDVIESIKQGKEVTGHFWYVVDAVDKAGNTFQLDRGYATSVEQLLGLRGVRIRFGVPIRNTVFDGGHWLDTIKEWAAQYRTLEDKRADGTTEAGKKFVATFKIFSGDEARGWRHKVDGVWRSYSEPKADYADVLQPDGTWLRVNLSVYRWSNFSVTNQLQMLRMGMPGKPKFIALDVSRLSTMTRAKEVGDFAYDSQMNGQILGEERNKRKWINLHPQQHYADCSKMGIVLKAMKGLIGHQAAPDEAAQESGK